MGKVRSPASPRLSWRHHESEATASKTPAFRLWWGKRRGVPLSAIPYRQPFDEFAAWFAEAQAKEPRDANAMTVATATSDGLPSARMLLLKGVDERGFVFYSNLDSRK